MAERGEIEYLPRVARELERLLGEQLGVVVVDVTTAVPMGDELRAKVKDKCERDFDRPVYLVEHVEPKILGGIIIEARGHRRDASVRTHLMNIRKALSSTYVGGDE